ncbi:hypothetical protein ACJRO7_011035 [Eucalyptus globulus]|uniref:Uncharacterized protein n=1 Tax=Eucalyptus globulus TaxID=34317 RepID=A0ABD3LE34_EUCGL
MSQSNWCKSRSRLLVVVSGDGRPEASRRRRVDGRRRGDGRFAASGLSTAATVASRGSKQQQLVGADEQRLVVVVEGTGEQRRRRGSKLAGGRETDLVGSSLSSASRVRWRRVRIRSCG